MKYPIGIQMFDEIRKNGWAYVDKTEYVFRIADRLKYVFLGRPRRFGKSLLLSTMQAYFEGRKDLFEGLKIFELETEWESYPVLRFDFSGCEASEPEKLETFILEKIREYENVYDIDADEVPKTAGLRFGHLIRNIHLKTGKQVVILVDEYDKGILETIQNAERLDSNQNILRSFFSQLKGEDAHIRFCLLTGVTRFRHLTIFSGLNNLTDISMDARYAAICGFTQSELDENFSAGIEELAKSENLSVEDTRMRMRHKYDGYRFSKSDTLVYNPFSILQCLERTDMSDYWLMTGTSKVFISYLKNADFEISKLEDTWADEQRLSSIFSSDDPIPLLFQTGYLTVKDYDEGMYKLGIPNSEVRSALVKELMPQYMGIGINDIAPVIMSTRKMLQRGDAEGFIEQLRSLIAGVPYHTFDNANVEKTYHLICFLLCQLAGLSARSEVSIAGGRIDMVIETPYFIYIIEFKMDDSAELALEQIDSKNYTLPWEAGSRKVYKIGISFSSQTRNITDYIIR